ncbi:GNAT family N-acetyltransferase [Pseudoalteromonas mariniglutinosa]|uniref:GNAT family N-acetyltransferase n=1 Tax=Pseudoalteromonas mariniglutinosa TaxID=206042 RepID=UPI00384DBD18
MAITLEQVNNSNYEAVCDLEVTDEQQHYVASNMWSLVESHYNQGYTCRAIYRDGELVGFFMWVLESPVKVSIWRFMVDKCYQQTGIGRAALALALREIKAAKQLKEIEICYHPHNPVVKDFYSSFGFQEVGLDEEGEDMLAIIKL